MKDEDLLEAFGWTTECQSPFEIRSKDGSFASGQAAHIVVDYLREDVSPEVTVQLTFEEIKTCIKGLAALIKTEVTQSCSRDFHNEELQEKLLGKFYTAFNVYLEKRDEHDTSE